MLLCSICGNDVDLASPLSCGHYACSLCDPFSHCYSCDEATRQTAPSIRHALTLPSGAETKDASGIGNASIDPNLSDSCVLSNSHSGLISEVECASIISTLKQMKKRVMYWVKYHSVSSDEADPRATLVQTCFEFMHRVDERLHPDYYDVIAEPICISSIERRAVPSAAGDQLIAQFGNMLSLQLMQILSDMRLLKSNAFVFNRSEVSRETRRQAQLLTDFFEAVYRREISWFLSQLNVELCNAIVTHEIQVFLATGDSSDAAEFVSHHRVTAGPEYLKDRIFRRGDLVLVQLKNYRDLFPAKVIEARRSGVSVEYLSTGEQSHSLGVQFLRPLHYHPIKVPDIGCTSSSLFEKRVAEVDPEQVVVSHKQIKRTAASRPSSTPKSSLRQQFPSNPIFVKAESFHWLQDEAVFRDKGMFNQFARLYIRGDVKRRCDNGKFEVNFEEIDASFDLEKGWFKGGNVKQSLPSNGIELLRSFLLTVEVTGDVNQLGREMLDEERELGNSLEASELKGSSDYCILDGLEQDFGNEDGQRQDSEDVVECIQNTRKDLKIQLSVDHSLNLYSGDKEEAMCKDDETHTVSTSVKSLRAPPLVVFVKAALFDSLRSTSTFREKNQFNQLATLYVRGDVVKEDTDQKFEVKFEEISSSLIVEENWFEESYVQESLPENGVELRKCDLVVPVSILDEDGEDEWTEDSSSRVKYSMGSKKKNKVSKRNPKRKSSSDDFKRSCSSKYGFLSRRGGSHRLPPTHDEELFQEFGRLYVRGNVQRACGNGRYVVTFPEIDAEFRLEEEWFRGKNILNAMPANGVELMRSDLLRLEDESDESYYSENDCHSSNDVIHNSDEILSIEDDEARDALDDMSDQVCDRCGDGEQAELLLLCDGCECALHTFCVQPALDSVPEGDWFCSICVKAGRENISLQQSNLNDISTGIYENSYPINSVDLNPRMPLQEKMQLQWKQSGDNCGRLWMVLSETKVQQEVSVENYYPSSEQVNFSEDSTEFKFNQVGEFKTDSFQFIQSVVKTSIETGSIEEDLESSCFESNTKTGEQSVDVTELDLEVNVIPRLEVTGRLTLPKLCFSEKTISTIAADAGGEFLKEDESLVLHKLQEDTSATESLVLHKLQDIERTKAEENQSIVSRKRKNYLDEPWFLVSTKEAREGSWRCQSCGAENLHSGGRKCVSCNARTSKANYAKQLDFSNCEEEDDAEVSEESNSSDDSTNDEDSDGDDESASHVETIATDALHVGAIASEKARPAAVTICRSSLGSRDRRIKVVQPPIPIVQSRMKCRCGKILPIGAKEFCSRPCEYSRSKDLFEKKRSLLCVCGKNLPSGCLQPTVYCSFTCSLNHSPKILQEMLLRRLSDDGSNSVTTDAGKYGQLFRPVDTNFVHANIIQSLSESLKDQVRSLSNGEERQGMAHVLAFDITWALESKFLCDGASAEDNAGLDQLRIHFRSLTANLKKPHNRERVSLLLENTCAADELVSVSRKDLGDPVKKRELLEREAVEITYLQNSTSISDLIESRNKSTYSGGKITL